MTVEPTIKRLIEKFEHKVAKSDEIREKLMPVDKVVNIDLGTEFYSLHMKDAAIGEYMTRLADNPDITLITTPEYLMQLVSGELRPMRAYVTKKIQVKGKIQDIMHLKNLL
ncbi:MAG: SCP2 sterol-binding domain-containing protein [Candidatus Methanomethylophilaceae archaeon]